jgi:signal transduction histidine kinase
LIEPATNLLAELYNLFDRLSAARGLDAVLDEVLSAAMSVTDSEMGNIGLYSKRTQALHVVTYRGFPQEYVEYMSTHKRPVQNGPSAQAIANRCRIVVPDVSQEPAFELLRPWVERADFTSMQATPILSREGEAIGTICTYSRNHHVPSAERLSLLDIYSKLAADAIERERAEESLRESEERFRGLHALTAQLSEMNTLEESLDEVLSSVISLVGADAGLLRLFEDDHGTMPFVTRRGLEEWFIHYFATLPRDLDAQAPTRYAITRREAFAIEDIYDHPVFKPHQQIMERAGFRSVLAVPLINQTSRPVGAICTYFRDRLQPEPERMQILELYARLASNSIERLTRAAEMERTEQKLREALSTKDQFLGMVSHELRTPMTMIRGLASVLRRNRVRRDVLHEVYQDLGDASERLYRLIENMLILARLEVGQTPKTELLLVDKLLGTTTARLTGEMPNLRLQVGPLPADVIILGIRQSLEQILRNLFENADKYSEPGSPVEFQVTVREDVVQFSILDRGMGLKNPEEIFQPFRRDSAAEQVAPGLGLGLAVCKMLLDAQGGKIWAEPRLGGGSAFHFTLNRAREEDIPDLAI